MHHCPSAVMESFCLEIIWSEYFPTFRKMPERKQETAERWNHHNCNDVSIIIPFGALSNYTIHLSLEPSATNDRPNDWWWSSDVTFLSTKLNTEPLFQNVSSYKLSGDILLQIAWCIHLLNIHGRFESWMFADERRIFKVNSECVRVSMCWDFIGHIKMCSKEVKNF